MLSDTRSEALRCHTGTARKMWKDGGAAGLFRGNLSTVLKVLPQSATQFAVCPTEEHIWLLVTCHMLSLLLGCSAPSVT